MTLEELVLEWSYRTRKGYPKLDDPSDILILKSSVNYTGNSSMEIGVRIESENTISGEINHTASAYLTFVSLDDKRKPKAVEEIIPESPDEVRRLKQAEMRKKIRKARLKKIPN